MFSFITCLAVFDTGLTPQCAIIVGTVRALKMHGGGPKVSYNYSGGEGEQGWRSGESTLLTPICAGFDFRARRHMWVEFVFGFVLKVVAGKPLAPEYTTEVSFC